MRVAVLADSTATYPRFARLWPRSIGDRSMRSSSRAMWWPARCLASPWSC